MNNFIIFDTEYTSWRGCQEHGWDRDAGQQKELVQLGAFRVNGDTLQVIDEFNSFAKPSINPKLSSYFTDLTGITNTDIENAPIIPELLQSFYEWSWDMFCFSYGDDFDIIQENLRLYSLHIPFEKKRFLDIRAYFACITSQTYCTP